MILRVYSNQELECHGRLCQKRLKSPINEGQNVFFIKRIQDITQDVKDSSLCAVACILSWLVEFEKVAFGQMMRKGVKNDMFKDFRQKRQLF